MLRNLFMLPKSDRYAALLLLLVALVLLLIYNNVGNFNSTAEVATDSVATSDNGKTAQGRGYEEDNFIFDEGGKRVERFTFDPNTADSTALLRLGLSKWSVRSIYRYRNKGGVFRHATDFANVYGLTQKQYRELEPYIRIGEDYHPARETVGKERINYKDSSTYTNKIRAGQAIDLNVADSAMLCSVPGIGPYFSRQILYYRNKLGGFYSASQLLEIEDFPKEAVAYFKINVSEIHRLSVNKLTQKQLYRHPYINYYQAKAISNYKRLKGNLTSVGDLKLMPEFTDKDLDRLSHYLSFE